MIQLELNGKPACWSASQQGKNGFYDKKAKEKEYARWQLRAQYRETPIAGFFAVDFVFFIPIPKNTSRAMRAQMLSRKVLPTSPDTTNLQKLYEDCLQGIVVENDRYANRISSVRYYSDRPGVLINLYPWQEYLERRYFPAIESQQQLVN